MHNRPFSQFDEDELDRGPQAAIDPRRRLAILGGTFCCLLTAVAARVTYIQHVIAGRFVAPWEQLLVEEELIPSRDGRILSRDGAVLARDDVRYDVAVDYRRLESPPDADWLRRQVLRELSPNERNAAAKRQAVEEQIVSSRERLLSSLADVSGQDRDQIARRAAEIQRRVETMVNAVEQRRRDRVAEQRAPPIDWSAGFSSVLAALIQELQTPPDRIVDDPLVIQEELQDHVLLRDVSLVAVAAIQSQPARFPGVRIHSTTTRTYPLEDAAAHVVGVRRPDRSAAAIAGPERRLGRSGIERSQDRWIQAEPGLLRHWHDRRGERRQTQTVRPPHDGRDVTLAIDSRLQRWAESLLDDALSQPATTGDGDDDPRPVGGCLIAMDIWTGDILTMASAPRPSLAVLSRPTAEQWEQLVRDPRNPLFPRATRMALPAGSIFKIVTAAAALESGVTTPDESFSCRGYLDEPDQYRCLIYRRLGVGHGDVQLRDALCQSCNVYFYALGRRMGPGVLCEWAERLGFGQATGVDLPQEHPGLLPRPDDPNSSAPWYPGTALQLAVGQGPLLATPLQVVRMMSAVANGGYLVTPRIVLDEASADDGEVPLPARIQKIPGLSERTLLAIREGLEMAVQDERGTGRSAHIEMMKLAGLTGTAAVSGGPDHAWFAGYAPAENPRVAFVVVLEHGGTGERAAPIAREFIIELLGYGYLVPFAADPRDTQAPSPVPIDLTALPGDTSEGD